MKRAPTIKSIGRKRRAAGWTLLTLGVFVAAVWVASGWWTTWVAQDDGGMVSVSGGQVHLRSGANWMIASIASPDGDQEDRWSIEQRFEGWRLWYGWSLQAGTSKPEAGGISVLPETCSRGVLCRSVGLFDDRLFILWPIPLLLCTPAALLLRSGILARRRAVKGMCTKCGYSLAGLAPDAPCPECGKAKTG